MLTMLNTSKIIERIQEVMEQHELNASSFAETIGVQRSSISHILSGRNKPSLEFLTKLEASFEDISFEWLLKGEPYNTAVSTHSPTLSQISPGNETGKTPQKSIEKPLSPTASDDIVKIVHYYADGSFESFFKR